MGDMPWRRAILKVLSEAREPLHYSDIAQRILDNGLREHGGATPAATVASTISTYMQNDLVRVDRGVYGLTSSTLDSATSSTALEPVVSAGEAPAATDGDADDTGFLNAFGMFWRREEVNWEQRGQTLLGAQLKAAQSINFADQVGVYILYSGDRVIYVGRITEPRLGPRLWDHTRDRLTGRWDRFSWFGVRAVSDDGSLGPVPAGNFAAEMLVATMEALLIEGLEPPQNRRRGDGFNATEFIQTTDPQIERRRAQRFLARLANNDQ
ncbi:HTH domain-containing protein [Microbacterium binotii]|uniref:HTH HARE-type domain-containing protein n=1 Tax=Microbacterium binotii TaxID=462710 RepID=A0ABN3PFY2_9MICO